MYIIKKNILNIFKYLNHILYLLQKCNRILKISTNILIFILRSNILQKLTNIFYKNLP